MPRVVETGNHKLKVSITLSPKLLARVDERAEELESSRSAVIQAVLREHFATGEKSPNLPIRG